MSSVLIAVLIGCDAEASSSDNNTTKITSLTSLTATLGKIGTGTTAVAPANFMVFDISTTETFTEDSRLLEFMLYPSTHTPPTTLSELRVNKTITYTTAGAQATDIYLPSIIKSGETTSIYFGYDAEANIGLSPATTYVLYVAQPGTDNEAPINLGTFTTGPAATGTAAVLQYPDLVENTGTIYHRRGTFLTWVIAFSATPPATYKFLNNGVDVISHVGLVGSGDTKPQVSGTVLAVAIKANNSFGPIHFNANFATYEYITYTLLDN